MSKKTVCSVPSLWTLEEYARHRCDDNSHKHLSRAQVIRYERQGRVRWLRREDSLGKGAVLKLTAPPVGHMIDQVQIRGVSCRVGEAIAIASWRGELWARVMMANIDALRVRPTERMDIDAALS